MQSYGGSNTASMSGGTLGIEGIREYRVITSGFGAEYGMTMGSQMMIVSKGGTNSFHGSVFEYLRNDNLDARNFFDLKTERTPGRLPEFKRNNFGASLGGPIKKDQAFFHMVYEGFRERLGVTKISDTIPISARPDLSRVAPVVRPLLDLYPAPNLPGDRYTFPFSQPTREDYGQARADYTLSDQDSAFIRYTTTSAERVEPHDFQEYTTARASRGQWTTLAENHVFSPQPAEYLSFLIQSHQDLHHRPIRSHRSPVFASAWTSHGCDQCWRIHGLRIGRAEFESAEYLQLE